MKAPLHLLIPLGLAAALVSTARGIEAPADNAPPPAAPQQPADKPEAAPVAFLGLGTDPVPAMLAAHLNLEPDQGVVVRAVLPDGPAAKAAVAVNDVILRLAGKAINSHEALVAEILQFKPGEQVAIDLIHCGKPGTVTVTLGQRPHDAALRDAAPDPLMGFERIPGARGKALRELLRKNINPRDLDEANRVFKGMGIDMDEVMKQAQQQAAEAIKGGGNGIRVMGGATVIVGDAEGKVEIRNQNGKAEAVVRDHQGKEVWSGPWNTEQDKAAAPPDVRARIERLNIGGHGKAPGIHLRFGNEPDQEPAPAPQPAQPAAPADDDAPE